MKKKAYMVHNPLAPSKAVVFNADLCTGCNVCVNVCRMDVLVPNPETGKSPIVLYPDECYFCGDCEIYCPVPGANKMVHPLNQRVGWKRKETGEYFRVGMSNPPPPNTRPACG